MAMENRQGTAAFESGQLNAGEIPAAGAANADDDGLNRKNRNLYDSIGCKEVFTEAFAGKTMG